MASVPVLRRLAAITSEPAYLSQGVVGVVRLPPAHLSLSLPHLFPVTSPLLSPPQLAGSAPALLPAGWGYPSPLLRLHQVDQVLLRLLERADVT